MKDGRTKLHKFAIEGHLMEASILLANDAKPNIVDNYGYMPLHLAIINDRVSMIELLLGFQACPNTPTLDGKLPYELCKSPQALLLLLKYGAEIKHHNVENELEFNFININEIKHKFTQQQEDFITELLKNKVKIPGRFIGNDWHKFCNEIGPYLIKWESVKEQNLTPEEKINYYNSLKNEYADTLKEIGVAPNRK